MYIDGYHSSSIFNLEFNLFFYIEDQCTQMIVNFLVHDRNIIKVVLYFSSSCINLKHDCIAGMVLSFCYHPNKFIILNLNGLLVKKWQGKSSCKGVYTMHGSKAIQLRKGATSFLNSLCQNFKVGI